MHAHQPRIDHCNSALEGLRSVIPADLYTEVHDYINRHNEWGDPTAVHKFCSMLLAFVFEARPVIAIEDAVRFELESIAFRDGLKCR